MTPPRPVLVPLGDPSTVGEARRRAAAMAVELGLDEEAGGRAALVATELAGNVWKHAGGDGWCQLDGLMTEGGPFLRMVCADAGPGIADLAAALRDGYSTRSTPGTGLGAARRQSQLLDVHSVAGAGTIVTALVGTERALAGRAYEHAGVALAMPGQEECGDAWAFEEARGRLWVLVVDGLGHGAPAAAAAAIAVDAFRRAAGAGPLARLEAIHDALRSSRGAAVAVAEMDAAAGKLRYAGIGNVSGLLLHDERRALVSMNGTAGHHARTLRELDYPCPPGALLVMHSDGIASRWDLPPGVGQRDPATIAALLVRDHGRRRDDAGVAVARRRP